MFLLRRLVGQATERVWRSVRWVSTLSDCSKSLQQGRLKHAFNRKIREFQILLTNVVESHVEIEAAF
uniref:Uncharacterized protein n=1 Tax=Physcomitrium patens TaxID=3218 RepID=A0A2K1IHN9_PHYPA|nr:hypothetical protein PHYPA_027488 [Physcomitrium patens]